MQGGHAALRGTEWRRWLTAGSGEMASDKGRRRLLEVVMENANSEAKRALHVDGGGRAAADAVAARWGSPHQEALLWVPWHQVHRGGALGREAGEEGWAGEKREGRGGERS